MSLIKQISQRLSPQAIRFMGRLQFKVPILAPILRWASSDLMRGESIIRHGIGKGLKFDPQGGHPGFAMGTSDPLEQEALACHLKPGDVFYDIGANVGFFSTLGGRLVGQSGYVYAFEPFPTTAAIAKANALRNGFRHVSVIEAAVCDRDCTSIFVLSSESTSFHLQRNGETIEPEDRTVPVRTVSVDELVASGEVRPPSVVMIDAEGAELDVLRGMAETVRQHRPVIMCEVHWQDPRLFFKTCAAILGGDELYRIERLDGRDMPQSAGRFHVVMVPTRNCQTRSLHGRAEVSL